VIAGYATAQGTARYRDRFRSLSEADFYRQPGPIPGAADLWLSSIGLGTYLGEPDEAADAGYTEAISLALVSGINVLDSAINYRHQRSERNIRVALEQAIQKNVVRRDEILVCTKAGYLSFDANLPSDPSGYFAGEYIENGVIDPKELVGGMHCIARDYLRDQIERSRANLGLECIDLFYLHNPETQLAEVSREVFRDQLVGKKHMSLFEAAAHLGVAVVGSATLYQGRLTHGLPSFVGKALGMKNDAENAIQFSRSATGITTSLIGMGHPGHVTANLKPALLPPAGDEDWQKLFTARER